jgi:hypothetical protein
MDSKITTLWQQNEEKWSITVERVEILNHNIYIVVDGSISPVESQVQTVDEQKALRLIEEYTQNICKYAVELIEDKGEFTDEDIISQMARLHKERNLMGSAQELAACWEFEDYKYENSLETKIVIPNETRLIHRII